ncbi:MAG: ThiF family adenylyltransferase [Quisquiliibacterium sp.]
MIDGNTELIAHIGYPTHTFTAPKIYNPYFESIGLNVVVVPMSCRADHYPQFLRSVFSLENIRGALVTMPHKVTTTGLVDQLSATAQVAGSCNAVKRLPDGRLAGDMFDGDGFVRGVRRKGFDPAGARALVVGCGGVGSAIAASLADAGIASLTLFDLNSATCDALSTRLRRHFPGLLVSGGTRDPVGHDLIVNATPLGMQAGDPLPLDVGRIEPHAFVGDVVLKTEGTPLLAASLARGCHTLVGTDMLFEMIPAYLEFFDLPMTDADLLKRVARLGR